MAEQTIYVRASRAAVVGAVLRIPQEASVGSAEANAMMTRLGFTALGRIRQAFVVKSRGGTDEAGDRWAPLSPKTIAYSRTRGRGRSGRTRAEYGRPDRPSQALNAKQQDRWWRLYRQGLAMFKGDKKHAAARAWFILKKEGAVTLLDKYGHRQVEILRDTGLLLNSLSPGITIAEQVFRVLPGEVIVGTSRKGAASHHTGIPGRLPQRRLWPEPSRWPSSWWLDLAEQGRAGLIDIAISLLRNL